MTTLIQNLDPNRDCVNLYDLGNKLIVLIKDYYEEYKVLENEGSSDADYFAGLISAYSTVASMIGVPSNMYPPEVSEIC